MQPHEGTKSAASASRARMFIRKELGWMQGFPLGAAGWLQAAESSPAVTMVLDRERLRTSVHTITMLRRDFPRALPRLVGDTERWSRTHLALLDLLKPTIHDGAPLPASPLDRHPYVGRALLQTAQRLEQEVPQLRTWCTALAWYGWTDLAMLRAAFAWLTDHSAPLIRLREHLTEDEPLLAVRLWQLTRAHSSRRVAPVIELLAHEVSWAVPLEYHESFLQQVRAALKRDVPLPSLPPATLPRQLMDWVRWLSEHEAASQRRGLELLSTLIGTELLAPWPAWWSKISSLLRRLRGADKAERPRVLVELERLGSRTPPAVPTKCFDHVLRGFMAPGTQPLGDIVAKALPAFPAQAHGHALRLAFAHHWLGLWEIADELERVTIRRYVPAFADYAKPRMSRARGLAPWRAVWAFSPYPWSTVDGFLLGLLTERRALATFFRVLGSADSLSSRGEVRLLGLLAAYLPSARVEAAFAALRGAVAAKDYPQARRASIQFCNDLTATQPERFAPLLLSIEAADDVEASVRLLRPVVASFATANLRGLLIDLLVEGQLPELLAIARKLAFTLARGLPAPSLWQATEPSAWLANYPPTLHEALAALARHDPAAEQSAAKVLAKEFPERQGLERELARLREIEQPTDRQQVRIANLMTRLATTHRVSAQRLATLATKLRALLRHRVLDQWRAAVDETFRAALPSYLGIAQVPEWIADSEVVTAIAAIADLSPASQALAQRVLARRAGPAPWDLRDAPANRACIAALRARGIHMEPWLDDTTVTECTTTEGQLLRLSLERDPLAILNMGGHFDTCLSPGQFNFFSVFANIADVNKQVLYARTASGAVFGRVLLALTDVGGLLTFRRYCHGSEASFTAAVKDYVHDLAQRMNTLVVDTGSVATLVADRWYDDGSVDIARQIPAFEPGSELRRALPSLPSAALVGTLTRTLAPLSLNELTLPFVLALPELAARSDLVVALLPLIERTPLGASTLLEVVRAVEPTGLSLGPLLEQLFRQARRATGYRFSYEAADLLAQYAPVLALRLLRETRAREIRSWDDEHDEHRLITAARAAEKLRRRRQARSLYELALKKSFDEKLQADCRAALARLA